MTQALLIGIDGILAGLLLLCAVAIWQLYWRLSKANAELHRIAQTLYLAENVGGIGTWFLDARTQKLHWSDHVFKIHGRSLAKREPELDDAIDYYHPKDRERVGAAVERALQQKVAFEFKATLVAEDGTHKAVVSRCAVQTDEAGNVVRVFGVFIEESHIIQIDRFENDNFKIAL